MVDKKDLPTTGNVMTDMLEVVRDIRNRLMLYYPSVNDADQSAHQTITVARQATTTVTFTIPREYTTVIRQAYIDAISNATYTWYMKTGTFTGNEINLRKPMLFEHPQTFKCIIVCTNPIDQTADVVVDAIGIPKVG